MTIQEVSEQIEVPYRTIAYWIQKGLVVPHNYKKRQRCEVFLSEKNVKEIEELASLLDIKKILTVGHILDMKKKHSGYAFMGAIKHEIDEKFSF